MEHFLTRQRKEKKRKEKKRKGKERKGKERKGKETKRNERKGKERKGKERKGKERKGKERKGKERKEERRGEERRGEERRGEERRGEERKGKERKGKENLDIFFFTIEVVKLHEKSLEPKPFHPGIVNLPSNFPKMAAFNRTYHELEHHGICFGFGSIFKIQNGDGAHFNNSSSAFYLVRVFSSYSRDSGSRHF